jgi:hypothetical protein
MNEKLRKHVEILFAAAPKNQRTAEIKEELLNNLNEKYDDLLRNGYDSTAAFHIALSGIGDPDELFGTSPSNSPPSEGQGWSYPQASRVPLCFALSAVFFGIGLGGGALAKAISGNETLGGAIMMLGMGISGGFFLYALFTFITNEVKRADIYNQEYQARRERKASNVSPKRDVQIELVYPPPQKSRLLLYFALAIALPPIGIGCVPFIPLLGVFLMFLSFGISAGLFVYVMGSLLLKLFAGDSQSDYYQKVALSQAASSGMSQEFVQNELRQIGRVNRMRQIVLGLLIVFLLCAFVLPAVGFAFKGGFPFPPPWAWFDETIVPKGAIVQVDRPVVDFMHLDVSSALSVEYKPSDKNVVSIDTHDDLLQYIETVVQNGTLFIRQRSGVRFRHVKMLQITVYSEKVPKEITVNGAAKLNCAEPIKGVESLRCRGAGNLYFENLESTKLDIEVTGAARMEIRGKAETVNARVDGAAKLLAANLNTDVCTIEVDGASKAELGTIAKELSASADGASRLEYRGTPVIKKQDISGAAKIQGKGE